MAARIFRVDVWLCLLIGGLFATAAASGQDKPAPDMAGVWQGTLDVTVAKLRLVLDFKKKDGGGITGTMDSPDQGAFGLPIDEVTVAGKTVKFTMKKLAASYEGKVSDDGKLIQELPGLNHLFQTSQTGSISEYQQIEETINPAALEVVGEWLAKRAAAK